ncbi:MAG: DUF4837 family protein [Candidatus Hatepunaea meridiana]|nr:DUF4837 family protein [Candidatus Hatepunaea meridiana]
MDSLRQILLLLLIVLLSGCNTKPFSVGNGGLLVVVADELDRPVLSKTINSRFCQVTNTPQPEHQFEIIWTDGNSLSNRTRDPLLLLATTLNGQGSTADLLRRMLTLEVKEGIESGEYSIFTRHNPWARKQLLLIIVGRNKRELGERITEWSDSLYKWTIDFEYDRLVRNLIKGRKNKWYKHKSDVVSDFQIILPPDYIQTQQNDSLNFIRFIRHYPDRWITISWGKLDDDTLFNPQYIFDNRKTISNSFLDPVLVYDDHWKSEEVVFNDQQAYCIRGLWATQGPTGGGPFFSYGFVIPKNNYYYIIDGAIFSPGDAKMPYLWQLNAIAHSFQHNIDGTK